MQRVEFDHERAAPHFGAHEVLEVRPRRGWGEAIGEFITNRLSDGYGGLWMGAGALAIGSLGLLATKVVYHLFTTTPAVWGTFPAGAIAGMTTAVAIPLSHKMPLVLGERVKEKYQRMGSVALCVFLSTAAFTPIVSKSLCPHRVTYLGAALYGVLGALAAAGFSYMDHGAEKAMERHARRGQERPRVLEERPVAALDIRRIDELVQDAQQEHPLQFNQGLFWREFSHTTHQTQLLNALMVARAMEPAKQALQWMEDPTKQLKVLMQMEQGQQLFAQSESLSYQILSFATQAEREKLLFNNPHVRDKQAIAGDLPPPRPEAGQGRRYTFEDYKRLGKYSISVGLVTGVVAAIFLSFGTICSYLGEKAPILKGSLSVGAVGGVSTLISVLTLDFAKMENKRTKDSEKMFHVGTRVAAAFIATVALAPTLSQYLTSYHVGYLKAAGLTVAGMVGAVGVFAAAAFLMENEQPRHRY
ncbi:MAG: hypothetical protein AB7N99_04160 [Simkaniaceae bacterium]